MKSIFFILAIVISYTPSTFTSQNFELNNKDNGETHYTYNERIINIWVCPRCGNLNNCISDSVCYKCGEPQPENK